MGSWGCLWVNGQIYKVGIRLTQCQTLITDSLLIRNIVGLSFWNRSGLGSSHHHNIEISNVSLNKCDLRWVVGGWLYGTLQDWRTICVSMAMKIHFLLFVHFSMFISWYVHPDERDLGFNAKFLLKLWKISQFCPKKNQKIPRYAIFNFVLFLI